MTALPPYPSSSSRAERTIAGVRLLLATTGFFAVWLDPSEPQRFLPATYALQTFYFSYSAVVAAFAWKQPDRPFLTFPSHIFDIVVFSVLQFLLGLQSPFFVYFVFSMFCGAVRWGWQGTVKTGIAIMVTYIAMTALMVRTLGPNEFELNRFMVRILNLLISGAFLIYLGQYEEKLRSDIVRLARWPAAVGDPNPVIQQVLAYACNIIGANQAVAVWERVEEPRIQVAEWTPDRFRVGNFSPSEFNPLVGASFEEETFWCAGSVPGFSNALVGGSADRSGPADPEIHPALQARLNGLGLSSARLETERVSGRVFFTGIGTPTTEIVPLTEVVARQIGASLDQLYSTEQLKAVAAMDERIRLARDLHDGVLQSLTGIRLEIRSVAGMLPEQEGAVRGRMFAIERALAIEQRELRFFIGGMGPVPVRDVSIQESLAARLQALRERISLEWKTPVSVRVLHDPPPLPSRVEQAVPLMVHEAVVNALKHSDPSRVTVTIDGAPGQLSIVVTDDGHGFPFRGRYDHAALAANGHGPRSLLDRVGALGGSMCVESSDIGSRVEMRIAL